MGKTVDNEKLLEIRNALAALPILQERMDKLCRRINEAERCQFTIAEI